MKVPDPRKLNRENQVQLAICAAVVIAMTLTLVFAAPEVFGAGNASRGAQHPEPPGQTQTLDLLEQSSIADGYGRPPSNIQGMVNRVHAVVVATIESFDMREAGMYENGERVPMPTARPGEPPMGWTQGVMTMKVEQVLLDDGYVSQAVGLTGVADPYSLRNPQVGKTYVLALFRQPDNREYGFDSYWGVYEIDGDRIVRTDGTAPKIEAPTGVNEFIAATKAAVAVRRNVSLNEWNEPYADLPSNVELGD